MHGADPRARGHLPGVPGRQGWLIELGEGGEWPLFLDVFVEHEVEEVAARTQQGTKGTIEGPYYLPDQERLPAVADAAPTRPDEKGDAAGVRRSGPRHSTGTRSAGAEVDIWQADADGYYSGFAAAPARTGTCAAWSSPTSDGRFEITTVLPAPVPDPDRRPDRQADQRRGMAPVAARAPAPDRPRARHRPITTQLYFDGGDWLDSDVARRPSRSSILDPGGSPTARLRADYDFVLEPA